MRVYTIFNGVLSVIFILALVISVTPTSTVKAQSSLPEAGRMLHTASDTVSTTLQGLVPRVESANTPEVIRGRLPRTENSVETEVERSSEIEWEGKEEIHRLHGDTLLPDERSMKSTSPDSGVQSFSLMAEPASRLGENLVPNATLESDSGSGRPSSWFKGGYGSNTRTLTYPVSGVGGSKAMKVEISAYTSGDAKWYSDEIPVVAGKTYRFSNHVMSTIPSYVTLRFKTNTGSYIYKDILYTEAHPAFTEVEATFTVPQGVVSLSIFHLIKEAGVLVTDNYTLQEIIEETQGDGNLLPNPGFEINAGSGRPSSWFKGGYGSNTRTLTYPVSGVGGSSAVEVRVSNYASGDAKWYHEKVSVDPGLYTYTDYYKSSIPSVVTVQFEKNDGSYAYLDIAKPAASPDTFREIVTDFTVPQGTVALTVFHLIKGNGSLAVDEAGLYKKTGGTDTFASGAVSFTFDDGWRAHHDIAMEKLNNVGLKGTFYIISQQLTENGFPGFLTKEQVRNIHGSGHEIGSHTRTHRPLTSLTAEQQKVEIEGAKKDLEDMGVGPVTTFAYPFGDYNASILSLVKNTPYDAARATINGNAVPSSDVYQLPRFSMEVDSTLSSMKQAVDYAIENKEWIIFAIHRIDYSGERYSVTPETFRAIVDYVDSKNVYVPTIAEGVESL